MDAQIPVLIFQPPVGKSAAEKWVAQGRLNAALDLISRLERVHRAGEIYILAADPQDRRTLAEAGGTAIATREIPFHFGRALLGEVERRGWSQFAYFGGASSPLLTADHLEALFERAASSRGVNCWVNNYHSTDWAILRVTGGLAGLAERLPTDNALGWVLANEAGYDVQATPPEAATSVDIDTPADVVVLKGHPQTGPRLSAFVEASPEGLLDRVSAVQRVMGTPGRTLTVIGRASSRAWAQLEARTQIWVRMLVEERGMVASRRVAEGKVRSLVAALVEASGPRRFVEELCRISDGALWDTRVWMAHRGGWPSDADRFAADLGWLEDIHDPALRQLTAAVMAAPRPILTGGHGLVSGGIYALLDTMSPA